MQHGYCFLSIIPLRSAPKHSSEQVSQLLWGECFEVLNHHKEWVHIRSFLDSYEGWIHHKQVRLIDETTWQQYTNCQNFSTLALEYLDNQQQYRLMGSPLINTSISSTKITAEEKNNLLEQSASAFLHAPYLWGGRSVLGVDCSGFVQIIYRLVGIFLPRDAYQQAELGNLVNFGQHQFGDLAYFENEQGRITHVGMVWEEGQIIHASGQVRIDSLDQQGIQLNGECTHPLSFIKHLDSYTVR